MSNKNSGTENDDVKIYPKIYMQIRLDSTGNYQTEFGIENVNHPVVLQAIYMAIVEVIGTTMLDNINKMKEDTLSRKNLKPEELKEINQTLRETHGMFKAMENYLKEQEYTLHYTMKAAMMGVASGGIKPYSKDFIETQSVKPVNIAELLKLRKN